MEGTVASVGAEILDVTKQLYIQAIYTEEALEKIAARM